MTHREHGIKMIKEGFIELIFEIILFVWAYALVVEHYVFRCFDDV